MKSGTGEPLLRIDRDRTGSIQRLSTNGGRVDFEYDASNRVITIVATTGDRLQFEYDS